MKNRTNVAGETPLTGSRSINAARQPRKMPKLECTVTEYCESDWNAHDAWALQFLGFRLTRADIMYIGKIETLLRLYIASFLYLHWRKYSRYRTTTECKTIARYVSAEHENEISIRFYLVPRSLKSACRSLQGPKNLLGLRKAFEPVGHYYLCHVGEIRATKEYNAGSVKRDNIKKAS